MHQTPGSLRPTRLARPAMLVLSLTSMVFALFPVAAAPAAGPKPLFEEIGTLERFPDDARAVLGASFVPTYDKATAFERQKSGTAIMLAKVRQLWQFYPAPLAANTTAIVVRDLDTLKILLTLKVQDTFDRATIHFSDGGTWAYALDDTDTRLFILRNGGHHVYEFNVNTLAFKLWPLPTNVTPLGIPSIGPTALTFDRFENKLIVLFGGPSAGSAAHVNTFVYQLDLSGTPPTSFPATEVDQMYRIRACTAPVTSGDAGGTTYNWEPLVTKDLLYIPCQRLGHTVIVVRLARPNGNNPNHVEDVTAGPVYGDTVLADQGSGRLFVTTSRREIWAFETSTMSFVGVVATGPQETMDFTGFGLDPDTGRVFFQSAHFGLGVAEGRFFPIPQARTMPRPTKGQERIWSDASTSRIFVLDGDDTAKAAAYRIFQTGPAPVPPPPPDPDRNTADVAEKEGVTEARFNAGGSGYGTRILWAKGYATVVPAPTAGTVAPTVGVMNNLRNFCGYVDRDLFFGRVGKTEYDTGSTAASAVATDVDDATEQDLNQPTRCQLHDPNKDLWTYTAATCATSQGDKPVSDTGKNGDNRSLGTSSVACPEPPGGTLRAQAETTLTGVVEVDKAWTRTSIERSEAGIVSVVESVAQGVTLDEVLSIGEIRSKATSTSNGRPKRGDMSTHDISIQHVVFGGQELCATDCDPVDLERRLNLLAGGRAVFRTGHGSNSGRDETLVDGSPRGAQTAVQKSVARQASDRALVGDFTVEIPALEMTVFNDNTEWGRARQVYQFAGVSSSATYNIVLRPTFAPFDEPGLDEEPAIGDGGSSPFTELIETVDSGGTNVALPVSPVARAHDDDKSGGLVGVLKAVARGIRLFLTSPRTALLLLTAWALLSSPAVLSRRRRLLAGVRTG
jgi:hypothetical protein